MRWIVGIDLRDLSRGAVGFARWMARRAPGERFIGGHVVEYVPRSISGGVDSETEPAEIVRLAEAALGPLRGDPIFGELGAIEAATAEQGLQAAARETKSDVFILGRRKPGSADALVRLGRVARRMLRALPLPVFIVPPDSRDDAFFDGPVLVATDLGPSSIGAAQLGKRLAEVLHLDILVTHVARVSDELHLLLPDERWNAEVGAAQWMAGKRLDRWIEAQGLANARTSVVTGSAAGKLLEVANAAGASMIVVGSRGLGPVERLFVSSLGSELAAAAPIPVAVVPQSWAAGA